MSHSDKGLNAIHFMIVRARFHAGIGTESRKAADILDKAEYLLSLYMKGMDKEFRAGLAGLGQRFPEFNALIEEYDREPVAA